MRCAGSLATPRTNRDRQYQGLTGHAMGTGIEDVVAVKALETGCVPPVANFKEVDPELGRVEPVQGRRLSRRICLTPGRRLRFQISMTLLRWVDEDGVRPSPNALGYAYRIADPAPGMPG